MAGETTTTTTEDPSTTTTTTVDESTTTTTTVEPDTTTTTTEVPSTTTTTTEMPLGEGTEPDNSPVLGDHGQTEGDRLDAARHEALVNSQGEQDSN